MKLNGKAWKFGDNISTDHIAPGPLFHLRSNLPELAKHVLEDPDPEFAKKVQPADFGVGGSNFGLGSVRTPSTIIKLARSARFGQILCPDLFPGHVGLPVCL